MSHCDQVHRVLKVLNLEGAFDFIATIDDVERGKPDPEIYQLVSHELGIPPTECLVIEDSSTGVRAALTAGTWCIAVTIPLTRERIHAERLLDERWIVDNSNQVSATVRQMIEERKNESRD